MLIKTVVVFAVVVTVIGVQILDLVVPDAEVVTIVDVCKNAVFSVLVVDAVVVDVVVDVVVVAAVVDVAVVASPCLIEKREEQKKMFF